MSETNKDVDAFNQVKNAVNNLRGEYDEVCARIAQTEKKLADLPILPVPVADLKAAILDMVDKAGEKYISEMKNNIQSVATNKRSNVTFHMDLVGKPLRFKDLNAALYGGNSDTNIDLNILTQGNTILFDFVLCAVAGALVKASMSKVMDNMTDAEFGYAKLLPSQIGTDRATRIADIKDAEAQLGELLASKKSIAEKLRQLGVSVAN